MFAFEKVAAIAALCVVAAVAPVAADESFSTGSPSPAVAALVNEALMQSPQILSRQAELEAMRARRSAAEQPLYNPELQLDTEGSDVRTTTAGISQTLDWSGKRDRRGAAMEARFRAAEARYDQARMMLATRVLSALVEFQTAEAVEAVAARETALMERFADLALQRQAAGDLTQADLELARLALAQARFRQAGAASDVADAEALLAAVLGEARIWPRLSAVPPVPVTLPVEDIERHLPSLRVAEFEWRAAREGVDLRRLERRPDPTLGIRAGREDSESLFGLSFSIPLYVRNRFDAEVREAESFASGARADMQSAYQDASARLDASTRRYRAMYTAWRQWRESGQVALDSRTELLDRLWRSGEMGATDYLVQLRQSLSTREEAANHLGRTWRAWVRWLEASGRTLEWLGLDERDTTTE